MKDATKLTIVYKSQKQSTLQHQVCCDMKPFQAWNCACSQVQIILKIWSALRTAMLLCEYGCIRFAEDATSCVCNVWHAHDGLCNYHDDNARALLLQCALEQFVPWAWGESSECLVC